MSSEEEQESLDDDKGGEFWLKMITESSSGSGVKAEEKLGTASFVAEKKVEGQAWSAEEEQKAEIPSVRKQPVSVEKKNVAVEGKLGDVVEKGEDSDDNISLAPSLEMFSDDELELNEGEKNNNQEDVGDSDDDDIGLAIYNLGNYCKRMLRGVLCLKPKCSWVHYMATGDAVSQFYRICSNRSVRAVVRFYKFFTNLEVQAQMVIDAQEFLARTDPGEVIDIDPKQVCREVFKAMVKVSHGLDLSIEQYMGMVEISSSLYTTVDGKDTLVPLFGQTCALVADVGPNPAALRLVKWSWTSLYLNSLSNGVVLPAQFYTDLCKLGDIKPGTSLLVKNLVNEDPSDVYKFYDSLPEIPGLNIPNIPPPAATNTECWMSQKLREGKWEDVAHHFCSINQHEVEVIADFAEKILMQLSQLCGQYQLLAPIPALYSAMLPVVISRQSEVHTQFFRQLGVALLVCQVTTAQWVEAADLVKLLANQLQTDFQCVKPPALSQFSELDRGMVPLFVLEVLVWTKQRLELVKYLEL